MVVQTNPISGSRPGRPWCWDRRRDKSKSRLGTRPRAFAPPLRDALRRLPACAGMTLLRTGLPRQTNPIWATARRTASGLQQGSCGDFGLQTATEKQSQFPAEHGMATAGKTATATGGASCTNKPNFRRYADLEIGGPRGSIAPNKPNLRRTVLIRVNAGLRTSAGAHKNSHAA